MAKAHIAIIGPLMTGMVVYADFFDYIGGIYIQEYGDFVDNHAVLIVGNNDNENYWICKNSWDTSWGESVWFRIKEGNMWHGFKLPVLLGNGRSSSALHLAPQLQILQSRLMAHSMSP